MKKLQIVDTADNDKYLYTIDCPPGAMDRVAHSLNWFFTSHDLTYRVRIENTLKTPRYGNEVD